MKDDVRTEFEKKSRRDRGPLPRTQGGAAPVLWEVQKREGWVNGEAEAWVAERLGVSAGPRPRRGDVLHHVQAAAVGQVPHPGLHDAVLHAARLRRADGAPRASSASKSRRGHVRTASSRSCASSAWAPCGTAPMFQLNDDYHEDLTLEKVDRLLDGLRRRPGHELDHDGKDPHRNIHKENEPTSIDVYEAGGGYQVAAQGAVNSMTPASRRAGQEVRASRPRRGRFSHRV